MRGGQKARNRAGGGAAWADQRDEVTGLLTYAGFLSQVTDAVIARTPESAPAVLVVDLEGLNEAAQLDEHTAGDELLRMVSTRVAREVGSAGLVGRMNE